MSDVVPAPPPVLILGMGRSGTSLLYRLLQLQKPFALGPDRRGGEGRVDLTETWLFPRAARLFEIEGADAHLLRQFLLFDEPAIARVAAVARRVPRWRAALLHHAGPGAGHREERVRWWKTSGVDRVVRAYFAAAREARGVARVVEKTPGHGEFLPEIRASFPERRILFSVRHPVDVYASMRRRSRRHRELGISSSKWLESAPEEFVAWARRRLWTGLGAAADDDLMIVRYEDVTREPVATLGRLGTFLGETLEPARLPGDDRADADIPHDPRLLGPITAAETDWREEVSTETASAIEAGLAEEIRALGYRPSADRPGPVGVDPRLE